MSRTLIFSERSGICSWLDWLSENRALCINQQLPYPQPLSLYLFFLLSCIFCSTLIPVSPYGTYLTLLSFGAYVGHSRRTPNYSTRLRRCRCLASQRCPRQRCKVF